MLLILLFLLGAGLAIGNRRLPWWIGVPLLCFAGLLVLRLVLPPVLMLSPAVLLPFAAAPAIGFALGRGGSPRRQRVIPRAELAALGTTITRADTLAAEGYVEDGFRCLVAGLQRAEEARESGNPWGRDLVGRWQGVVEE